MDPSVSWPLGVFAVALLLSATFSAAETALISLRRSRLERLVDEGRSAALLIARALEHPERALASIQAVNTTLAMVAAVAFTLLLEALAPRLHPMGIIGAAAGAWVFYLLFGEIVPKTIARRRSENTALLLIRPVQWMANLVFPMVVLLVWLGNLVVRLVPGFAPLQRNPYITEEEIKVLVEKGEEMGDLEEDEREMVTAIFDFDRRVVREVMVPRVDVTAVEVDESLDAVVEVLLSTGYTRVPVFEESLDNVVGVLHGKDLLRYLRHGKQDFALRAVMRPGHFVPENKNAKVLMEEMRAKRIPIAIVVDEYGGTAGVVTLEDLIEEIVGEIRDEYDIEEEDITRLTDDVALVNGRASIDEVNDDLRISLPTEEYDSVGGFLTGLFGRPPETGEEATWENVRFVVEGAEANRVRLVRILVSRAPEGQDAA